MYNENGSYDDENAERRPRRQWCIDDGGRKKIYEAMNKKKKNK